MSEVPLSTWQRAQRRGARCGATVGICLGSYGFPTGGWLFLMSEVLAAVRRSPRCDRAHCVLRCAESVGVKALRASMHASLCGRRLRFTWASEVERGPFAIPAPTRETLSNSLLNQWIPLRILRRGITANIARQFPPSLLQPPTEPRRPPRTDQGPSCLSGGFLGISTWMGLSAKSQWCERTYSGATRYKP